MLTDVAIIGFACKFPGQKTVNVNDLWTSISTGKSAVTEVPKGRWVADNLLNIDSMLYNHGGFIDSVAQFDCQFFNIVPAEAKYMDPQQRLLLQTAYHAFEMAGVPMVSVKGSSCGVYVGRVNNDYYDLIADSGVPHHPSEMLGNYGSVLAGRIAYFFDLKGPTLTIDTACSSSLMAIHLACNDIMCGKTQLALAGGVSLNLSPRSYYLMNISGMLSPSGVCSAFDQNADGFVPGEGVGLAVLKPLERALSDGDRIWGVIKSSDTMQDGKTSGISSPNSLSQASLISRTYEQANIDIDSVGLVETHGTGTKLGDPIELEALKEVFKKTRRKHVCYLSSIKPNIGHTLGAAGIAGIIKVLLCMQHKQIPPQANFKTLNPYIDLINTPFKINKSLKSWDTYKGLPRVAGVSSFGFCGTNVHVVIEEFKQQKKAIVKYSDKTYYCYICKHYHLAFISRGKLSAGIGNGLRCIFIL